MWNHKRKSKQEPWTQQPFIMIHTHNSLVTCFCHAWLLWAHFWSTGRRSLCDKRGSVPSIVGLCTNFNFTRICVWVVFSFLLFALFTGEAKPKPKGREKGKRKRKIEKKRKKKEKEKEEARISKKRCDPALYSWFSSSRGTERMM